MLSSTTLATQQLSVNSHAVGFVIGFVIEPQQVYIL